MTMSQTKQATTPLLRDSLDGSSIGFAHSMFAQCHLPYRDPQTEAWQRDTGPYQIVVSGGHLAGPNGKPIAVGIPYGTKARLILAHIQTYATRHRTRVIPIGRSLNDFMRALGFRHSGGDTGASPLMREQTIRIACSIWSLTYTGQPDSQGNQSTDVEFGRLVSGANIIVRQDEDGLRLDQWPQEITLSNEFAEALRSHAMPYDLTALRALSGNARAMDLYIWLAHRLRRISRHATVDIPMAELRQQFGGSVDAARNTSFTPRFRTALKAVKAVYPQANVDITTTVSRANGQRTHLLSLRHSPPPISAYRQREMRLTSGATP